MNEVDKLKEEFLELKRLVSELEYNAHDLKEEIKELKELREEHTNEIQRIKRNHRGDR